MGRGASCASVPLAQRAGALSWQLGLAKEGSAATGCPGLCQLDGSWLTRVRSMWMGL